MSERTENEPIHLIVAAPVQRSGSTLLQRICNRRSGSLIWGEHGGVLNDYENIGRLIRYFSDHSSSEREAFFGNGEDANQWIANMTPESTYVDEAVIASVRALFARLYAPFRDTHDRIGFKEVRYGRPALTLFRQCFPEADILLIVRHPVDTWRSSVGWYNRIGDFTTKWNENAGYYLELAEQDPRAHLVVYENLVNRDQATLDLISKVADVTEEEIELTLAYKVGSHKNPVSDADIRIIQTECSAVMSKYGYT
ncbi:sulfotransferase [Paenibacillus humicola]|uniref:sulfotransferase n=1 Tax=Paenibacillus humicola TaxID=3110540 RepID=UPI00237C3825|nr:sulfotransferase [Paenibacillus humicola]